jgi:hypothetical protein
VLSRDMRPDAEGLRAGDRAPNAPGLLGPSGPCCMFNLLRGPQVTLLGFGAQWQALIESYKAQFAGKLTGYVFTGAPADPRHYLDSEGHARAAYHDGTLFIVRPDDYVGLATDVADADAIAAYLSKIL